MCTDNHQEWCQIWKTTTSILAMLACPYPYWFQMLNRLHSMFAECLQMCHKFYFKNSSDSSLLPAKLVFRGFLNWRAENTTRGLIKCTLREQFTSHVATTWLSCFCFSSHSGIEIHTTEVIKSSETEETESLMLVCTLKANSWSLLRH